MFAENDGMSLVCETESSWLMSDQRLG